MPPGRWRTTAFLSGLRAEGLVAPLGLDGAVDSPAFLARVERTLAPALHPSDAAVADYLGSHKVAGVREAAEARGAPLPRPPPYSPDLNLVEFASNKPKRQLRTAAARTADALCGAIAAALGTFTPAACAGCLRHRGYARSGRQGPSAVAGRTGA